MLPKPSPGFMIVAKKRRMMFEYILIAGVNDIDE